MKRTVLFLAAIFCCTAGAFSQKMVHIPNYLQNPNTNDGAQFSWSKTAQSTNFIVIWGNTVGTNPASYPDPDLAFNPAAILDTMEYIYGAFKQLGFTDDAPGTNLSQYKIPIVMYGTWGPNGAQGFANGGDADGIIGAFWVHPTAMHDGGVAAHELTHSLQAQAIIDYRTTNGLGPVWLNAGIFWETHANFMRNLLYPKAVSAWGMDVYHLETWGDWKNTYENYELLFAIQASEGIDMVNRLWRESYSNEYPLQAYKRLAGYDQDRFNDSLYHYARRMATFDFTYNNVGTYFRQYRNADLSNYLLSIQAAYNILKKVPGSANRYEIPIEQAPEEFSYNIIPLYPHPDSCSVQIKFKGHTEANTHTGWRYGFVAAHPDGTVSRYSDTYKENTAEISFTLEGDETRLYLVVMGAPFDAITTNSGNDTWQGYPKHFRFPYELTISGAVPEGFQAPANFRSQLKSNGHLHSNGGGWVQNSASVASSVYVGPMAMVLGNSVLSGNVRVENTALVKNANLSGNVKVLDNAFVNTGTYSQSAIIRGQGYAENVTMLSNALIGMRAKVYNYQLSGTVEVGGDVLVYNEDGNCNNGVHYRLTNYYDNKLLECDGRTAEHPTNKDVNSTYALFSDAQMALQCSCATLADTDGDGFTLCAGDCNDTLATVYPGAPELCDGLDNNCDGIVPADELDSDNDGFSICAGDCDDTLATIYPGAAELCDGLDNNCDGIVPADELDSDGDGYSICAGDCNDSLASIYPGAPELCDGLDNNCDGIVPADELDSDNDGFSICAGDCNDTLATIYPGAAELCDGLDNNCDGIVPADELDSDGDGFSTCAGDCDNTLATVYPGAPELCDGLDNNCDGIVPADELDSDGDGYSICAGDCNDTLATVYPGAPELCDGLDNNCDGIVPADELDSDGDGYSTCAGDCNDSLASIYPGAPELCDGLDNNCDGIVPADELDSDGDGYSTCAGDCDNTLATVYPGAPELCDGLDNNCDGIVPADELDSDGDGYSTCAGDCNDSLASIYPGAPELCDGLDNNCDGIVPADELDSDGDGFSICAGDCNDSLASIFPGAPELCDGLDNNCDGIVPADELDSDGDGYSTCAGDCNDSLASIYPGAPELCDGLDNNCDGIVPADELDSDGDGFSICAGDCDDALATVYPGAPELCDGLDNNCDGIVPADELDSDNDGFSICGGDCDDTREDIFPGGTEIPNNGIDENCDGQDLVSALNDPANEYGIRVSPNPFQETLRIRMTGNGNGLHYELRDALGRPARSGNLDQSSDQTFIQTGDLQPGIYMLAVFQANGTRVFAGRLIKVDPAW